MITVSHLSKTFYDPDGSALQVLKDVSCEIHPGEVISIIGPSGTGKSTFLRALNLLDPPTGGSIVVDGENILKKGYPVHKLRQKMGMVFQNFNLFSHMTVLENVMEGSSCPEHFARTVMACLGIAGDNVFKPVHLLSGGERVKTALGKLLLADCNLLVMDEPTNHLDLFTLEELEKLLAGYGGTLLYVSHDEEFIRKTSTRIVRFEKEKLVTFEGGWEEMRNAGKRNVSAEERKIAISTLEMRMAALSARMSSPKKGDRPEELQAEYMRLAAEANALKRQ